MFWMRNKENNVQICTLIWGPGILKKFQNDNYLNIQDLGTAKSPESGIVYWLNIFNI